MTQGAGQPTYVAVVGAGSEDPVAEALAEALGERLARAGAVVVHGGLGGVMAGVSRGAARAGGISVGLLPGRDRAEANPWVSVALPTGMGELRNGLVALAGDVVVAVGGEYGTLSEVAFALKLGRPVVGLGTWTLGRPDGTEEYGIVRVADPAEASALAMRLARRIRADDQR